MELNNELSSMTEHCITHVLKQHKDSLDTSTYSARLNDEMFPFMPAFANGVNRPELLAIQSYHELCKGLLFDQRHAWMLPKLKRILGKTTTVQTMNQRIWLWGEGLWKVNLDGSDEDIESWRLRFVSKIKKLVLNAKGVFQPSYVPQRLEELQKQWHHPGLNSGDRKYHDAVTSTWFIIQMIRIEYGQEHGNNATVDFNCAQFMEVKNIIRGYGVFNGQKYKISFLESKDLAVQSSGLRSFIKTWAEDSRDVYSEKVA
jgi:hypothetical protein